MVRMELRGKKLVFSVVLIMLLVMILVGCSANSGDKSGSQTSSKTNSSGNGSEDGRRTLDVDDISQKVTVKLTSGGWINIPRGNNDPMQKWINDTFNVNFQFGNVPIGDLEKKLSLEFSSNEPPDLILFPTKEMLTKFMNEGVLVEDLSPYLDKVPAIENLFTDNSLDYVTMDGRMIAFPKAPREYNWSHLIRKDWLENLGLAMPTNEHELLEVLRQFTYNDPDQNGKHDTWGITSAGGGRGMGGLGALENMFGPAGYYMDQDGNPTTSILDGTHKQYLDFVKTLIDEKLIDPDWYTQGETQRKAKIFSGAVGITWDDVGDFFGSMREFTNNEINPATWWDLMPIPQAGEGGGKRPPQGVASGLYAISKKAAEDPVKLSRILKILNDVTYPGDGYFTLRWGVGVIDGNEIIEFGDNLRFCTNNCIASMPVSSIDWGSWIAVNDKTTSQTELNDWVYEEMDILAAAEAQPMNESIGHLINFNPQNKSDADQVQSEFDIKYLLGEATDYDEFVDRWLKQGGQALLDQIKEQMGNRH